MKNIYFKTYLILLHLLLLILFINPNLLSKAYSKIGITEFYSGHEYYREFIWKSYAKRSKTLQRNSNDLIFIGDSMLNGLCVESLFGGINMAVSGESINNARVKIDSIENLENKNIILAFGINDIPNPNEKILADYDALIKKLPASSNLYLSSILPINESSYNRKRKRKKTNKQIRELNELLEAYCTTKPNVTFLSTFHYLLNAKGELQTELHSGDGLHLNEKGNRLWAKGMSESLKKPSDNYFYSSKKVKELETFN